jgi:Velvet factor
MTTALSEPFLVYSAKKFSGMIESTELRRKLASQGIRIPVRHANEKKAALTRRKIEVKRSSVLACGVPFICSTKVVLNEK